MAKSLQVSRSTRWFLTIGILAILLITAGVVYGRQKAEQGELNSSITQAQQQLLLYKAPDPAEKKELEARLEKAESRVPGITTIQNRFREYTESIEINEALFQAAKDTNVTITSIVTSEPASEELAGFTFRVFALSITAESEVLPALINFSIKVSQEFAAADVESVTVTITEGEAEEEEEEGIEQVEQKATMELRLRVYVYE